jgi:hypothetical protein
MPISIGDTRNPTNVSAPPVPAWVLDAAPSVKVERAAYERAVGELTAAQKTHGEAVQALRQASRRDANHTLFPARGITTDDWTVLQFDVSDADIAMRRAEGVARRAWTALAEAVRIAPDAEAHVAMVAEERRQRVVELYRELDAAQRDIAEVGPLVGGVFKGYAPGQAFRGIHDRSALAKTLRELGQIIGEVR